ncbi:hypothetical protein BC332_17403 [Capsicum chinense]|nr:hypothetical protein BC332_17403 [Capsicum chinense]
MAAGNNNGGERGTSNENASTSKGAAVPDKLVIGQTKAALQNNNHIADEWTPEEQSALEELLDKYATENEMHRYAQIAMQLKDKGLRDVILRCIWMSKKGKQRNDHISRKNKDKKEKLTDSLPKLTHVANRTNGPTYARAVMPMDKDGRINYQAIGGPIGQLLQQNAQTLDQISANLDNLKIQENFDLLIQARNNLLKVVNNLNDEPEMHSMPPLPLKLNEELVNSILSRPPSFPDKS